MGTSQRLKLCRLQTILERQEPARYGADYIPSTLATREEAPSISRPAMLRSTKLNRDIHTLSTPETYAALLALYHPDLVDLHEQKMLSTWGTCHPLRNFPGFDGTHLPDFSGTVAVSERLGYLDVHPILHFVDPQTSKKMLAPFPYQGDLLLFMRKEESMYCLNWTVKDKDAQFTAPRPNISRPNSPEARRAAMARYEIEVEYYRDAGIRTQRISHENMDKILCANLSQLFAYTCRPISSTAERNRGRVLDKLHTALELEVPPYEALEIPVLQQHCTSYEARTILYQSIWDRVLRVDLFSPVLIDYPLLKERTDVINRYSDWFVK